MKPMTEAEYVGHNGVICPVCRAEGHIEGGSFDLEEGYAFQDLGCQACGASWSDVYALTGYTMLELNEED
jgi:hypothetical protein